jgi:phage-related protein
MAGPGGTEVGRVSVRVVPDLDNFRQEVEKELKEIERMEAEVEISLNLEKFHAQIEEVKAALKSIQDEEVNVNVDKNGGLASVGQDVKKAGEELSKASKKMKDLGDETDGTDKRVGKFANLLSSLGGFAQRAGGQLSDLGSKMGSEAASGAKSFGSSITALIVQLTIWVPLLLLAAGAITYLVGIIAAAIGSLPVLLFGLGAPIAALILGFDGLKKAFQPLGKEFDKLKERLANTFEKGLKPAVQALSGLMPILSDGLNTAAQATSDFINELAKVVTSKQNVENLKNAFAGVKDFLKELAPGVGQFITSLLNVAGATDAFKILGKTLSDVLFKFKGFFDQSLQDGSLLKGLESLHTTLYSLTGLFSALLRNSLKFFNGATPGMNKFFDSLSHFFLKIDWERLGKAFGTIFERLGKAIDQIPPQTIDSITTSFEDFADAIGDLLDGKSFDILISTFQLMIDIVTGVIHALDGFLETLANIGDFIAGIPDWFGDLFSSGGDLIGGLWDGAKTKFSEFQDWVKSIPAKIGEFFVGAGSWLLQKGQDIVNGIRDGAVTAFNNVVAFFQSIPGRIRAFFNGAINWLQETGRNIINGLGNGISGAWLVVQMTFASLKNRVIAFFYGAGSWLTDAGHKIISGLVNGIRSAIPTISGILGTITRLIPSWKGPLEKDKMLLFKNGQVIMGSLVNGLQDGFTDVQSTLNGMTVALGDAFTSPTLQGDITMSGQDIAAVGTSQLNVAGTVDNGLSDSIASALSGWTIQIDETGIARLVNKGQQRLGRRG